MAVNPIPENYPRVIPYLVAERAGEVIDFMVKVLGGQEIERMENDGVVMHAEVRIGESIVMVSNSNDQWPAMKSMLYVYVPDVDAAYKAALEFGCTSVKEPTNEFYGDRSCMLLDSSGNSWGLSTHVEDVSPEEIQRRAAEYMQQAEAKAG